MNAVKKLLQGSFALLLLIGIEAAAQPATLTVKDNLGINSNLNGLLEVRPSGYDPLNTTQRYPLLIFFQGIGSTGPGTPASLNGMITGTASSIGNGYIQDQFMNNAWPDSYIVNGNSYKFIALIPQFVIHFDTRLPTPEEVDDLIDYAIANYNVDLSRIYLVGNSSGGGIVWEYASAGSQYANRLAAILPFSGVSFPSKEKADVIRNANLAVWGFHNEFDLGVPPSFTEDFLNLINRPTPAVPEARLTLFPGETAHDSWFRPFNRLYTEGGLDMYQWMLQYSRTLTAANAGNDQIITLPANSVSLNATWTGSGAASGYSWQKISGPAQGDLTATNIQNPGATNLVEGTYIFRVTITPAVGAPESDEIAITVYPEKIEGEDFVAHVGLITGATADEGGGVTAAYENGDFGDYNLNLPVTGTYTLRFRATAGFGATQFVVKNSSGTVLTTVSVYGTPTWETYATMSRDVALPAGAQTIRLEATGSLPFNLNWIQVLAPEGSSTPVPVKFGPFTAKCVGNGIQLNWTTLTEINTKDFTIQRSVDGSAWKDIATMEAIGNEGEEQSYAYHDQINNAIYRIVANDLDGKKTYSSLLKVDCGSRQSVLMYPNPVKDIAQLNVQLTVPSRLQYVVVDQKGAVVLKGERALGAGTNQFPVDMSRLSNGMYTITLQWEGEVRNISFVKQ